MSIEWKYLFEKKILQRGHDYYLKKAVKNLKIKKNSITAEVIGSEEYNVEIELEDGEITEMYCDCPYADDGNYCKHMAAVMYAVDNKGTDRMKTEPDIDINKLIDSTKPEKLRNFLKDAVKDNDDLAVRLQTYLSLSTGKINMTANKRLVDNIIEEFTRYDGYITYRYADDFVTEMQKTLSHSVEPMIASGHLEDAFELLGYTFIETSNAEIDDDGELSIFGDECAELWRDIIAKADIRQKEKFFDWFVAQIDGSVIDYMEDYFIDAIMNFFDEKEFIEKKLNFTQKKADSVIRKDNYNNDYERERWTMLHIGLMEKSGASDEDISTYCKEKWKFPNVRKYCVERYIKKRKIKAAIDILNESLEIDKDKSRLIYEHRLELKELYKRQKNTEAYREQLWILLTVHNAGTDIYRELKALYSPEEWLSEREKILTDSKSYKKPDFYREEKLWDRLLQYVISSNSIFALEQYEPDLVKLYPQEILKIYADDLHYSARETHSRNTYKRWAQTLKHMKTIKGGEAVVADILAQWREAYKKRPAMMEELAEVDAPKRSAKKK